MEQRAEMYEQERLIGHPLAEPSVHTVVFLILVSKAQRCNVLPPAYFDLLGWGRVGVFAREVVESYLGDQCKNFMTIITFQMTNKNFRQPKSLKKISKNDLPSVTYHVSSVQRHHEY